MPSRQSTFKVYQRRSASRQCLFNTGQDHTFMSSAFNVRARVKIGQLANPGTQHLFNVNQRVTTSITMEWDVGMPVQFGLRAMGPARWYSMYPS